MVRGRPTRPRPGDARRWRACGEWFASLARVLGGRRSALWSSGVSHKNTSVERGNDPHETADTNGHGALRQGRAIDPGRWGRSLFAGRQGRGDADRSARRIRQPGIVRASAGGVSRPSPSTRRRRQTSRGRELRSSAEVRGGRNPRRAARSHPPFTGWTRGGRWPGASSPRGPGEGRESGPKVEGGMDGRREAARCERRNAHAADRSSRHTLS